MILVCPNCAARYEVDGTQFPAEGRKVRCKKCGHVWHQAAEAGQAEIEETIFNPPPESEPVPVAEPETEAEAPQPSWRAPAVEDDAAEDDFHLDAPESPAKRGMGAVLVMLGWAALVVVILVIGWSAANYRSQIVGIWPQSASLFSRLGMAVNMRGLDFADVRHTNQTEDGQPVLVITGKVVNVTGKKLDVPPLRVTLSDANKHAIYDWSFAPSSHALAPGQAVGFRTRLSNPPSATRHVELRFADGKE
jgi:predicted Zn finger-like uncharacterized protein